MAKLVLDIETIGENFDQLDETTREVLTHWIRKSSENEEEYQNELKQIKEGMGFSPLTGEIVVIGLLNPETNKGMIFFQAPGESLKETEENGIVYKPMSEKEMLEEFWKVAENYNEFITFNGMRFDVPFLAIRSAIQKVRPTKDLMSNRYLNSQRNNAKHVDLLDQLTFYGATRKRWNLHLWCRAFGIQSPKDQGVTGEDVARLFKGKKFLDIARYNVGDLQATKELYEYWQKYIQF